MTRRLALLACSSCALLLALWLWWRDGHPQAIVDAPQGRLDCVSYTPSHDAPLTPASQVARAQIEHDLQRLAGRFRCVRVYSVGNGIDQVPAVARELGLRVLLGLWIGRDARLNEQEIRHGLDVARRDHDVIEGVIVGNEVLLRREQTADRLAVLIGEVKAGTDLPVTYADVWDFWKANPGLAADVDFVTIHLLPYWDDRPTGIDAALAHTAAVHAEAHATFPGKRIFIGETGWPSQGRQRADAAPGRVAQARFVREFTHWAAEHAVAYNLIEAYDQPWKRAQEGTVGGYWGMYDAQGEAKFPLQGPVAEAPGWMHGIRAAAAGALLFVLAGLLLAHRMGRADLPLLALAGAAAGAVAPLQWHYLATTNRDRIEWSASSCIVMAGWMLFSWTLLAASGARAGQGLPQPTGIGALLRGAGTRRARALGLLRFVLLTGFAFVELGLALDPRYRGFPTCLYVLPVAALLLLVTDPCAAAPPRAAQIPEETLLAMLVGGGALLSLLREGPANGPALALTLLALLCAAGQLWPALRPLRPDQRAREYQQT